MVAPTALAETVTPPIFSPAGDVTVPVRIVGSAAHVDAAKAALDSTAMAVPAMRAANAHERLNDESPGDESGNIAGPPVLMNFHPFQRGRLDDGGAGNVFT